MNRLEEVKAFARDYIDGNQTRERRMVIRAAYFQITGQNLRITCSTCFIEAIFKILKFMEKKPCKYQLKKGAVLQAFGNADMFATADNLTDERAEWHLRNTRGAASLFAVMPADAPSYQDPNVVQPSEVDLAVTAKATEDAATADKKDADIKEEAEKAAAGVATTLAKQEAKKQTPKKPTHKHKK